MQKTKPVFILYEDIPVDTSPVVDGYFIKLMKDADLCAGVFNCLETQCPVQAKCEKLLNEVADDSTRRPLTYQQLLCYQTKFSKLRLKS